MLNKLIEFTGDVADHTNPLKTVRAVSSRNIPPLICLTCANSGDSGECTNAKVDITAIRARWQSQLVISQTDFQERVIPNTPLLDICHQYLAEE